MRGVINETRRGVRGMRSGWGAHGVCVVRGGGGGCVCGVCVGAYEVKHGAEQQGTAQRLVVQSNIHSHAPDAKVVMMAVAKAEKSVWLLVVDLAEQSEDCMAATLAATMAVCSVVERAVTKVAVKVGLR